MTVRDMPDPPALTPEQRDQIAAYAEGSLGVAERRAAQRLMETSEPARAHFRELTAGRFPRLPNYTIIEQVGRGGFGIVYRAVHHAKERTEALKVLFSKTPLLTSYFENEVHLIARLRHNNIATLHEAQLSSPPLYYTMGFVEGQRLHEYVTARRSTLGERIELIRTVAEALEYAHSQGVVHRDIKPQNILIDEDGAPHIVDFGISTRLGEAAERAGESPRLDDAPVGTIGYIAPEQRRGCEVDGRADIFSLGAVLFHCITGDPARHAGDFERTVKRLRDRKVGRPEDLAAIIARCVAPEPKDRYANCRDLIHDLDHYLIGRGVTARREPSLRRRIARRWSYVLSHHHERVLLAAAALIAVCVPLAFERLGARMLVGLTFANNTTVLAFTPQTEAAIAEGRIGGDIPGLALDKRKSLRLLHAELVRRLSQFKPRVVVFDYYFPDCQPEYDPAFIEAVRAAPFPVVVGSTGLEVNADPTVCSAIGDIVHTVATLYNTKPLASSRDYEVIFCVQRDYNPPIPGLALAGYAAAQYPECVPEIQIDEVRRVAQVRYRRVNPQPGQPRYLSVAEELQLQRIKRGHIGAQYEVGPEISPLTGSDRMAQARVAARGAEYWSTRVIAYEDVLTADVSALRSRLEGAAVVVGEMIPGKDEYTIADEQRVFGCQVHAAALDGLLGRLLPERLRLRELTIRAALWAALGMMVARLAGQRISLTHPLLARLGWIGLPLFALPASAAAYSASHPLAVETAIAAAAAGMALSTTVWVLALRASQARFAPARVALDVEATTLPSTVLAETEARASTG